jgi:hypothetical protein
MKKIPFRLFLLIALSATFPIISSATSLELTTDFSKPSSKDAVIGGDCPGRTRVFTISDKQSKKSVASGIYLGGIFLEETGCDLNKVVISLNNRAYLLRIASKRIDAEEIFYKDVYQNPKENIKVTVKHIKTLKETESDIDPECMILNRKVKIDIAFKGTSKTFYGITDGGCP